MVLPIETDPTGHKELHRERPDFFPFGGNAEVVQRQDNACARKKQRQNRQRGQGGDGAKDQCSLLPEDRRGLTRKSVRKLRPPAPQNCTALSA